jgi:hypothetical protein
MLQKIVYLAFAAAAIAQTQPSPTNRPSVPRRSHFAIVADEKLNIFQKRYQNHPEVQVRKYDAPVGCKASYYFGISDRRVSKISTAPKGQVSFVARLTDDEARVIGENKEVRIHYFAL